MWSSFAIWFPGNMRQNSCLAGSAAGCALQRSLWSVSAWITSKCCEDSVSQPTKWEIFSVLSMLHWCAASSQLIQCCTFCHEQQKSPKKQALNLTCWALCVDHTMHRSFSVDIFFPESLVCIFQTRSIIWVLGFSFSLRHGDLKWLKTEVLSPRSDA